MAPCASESCLCHVTGCPEYELKPGGTDIAVDASNVAEYVDAVADALLRSGIQHQMAAFRSVPVLHLKIGLISKSLCLFLCLCLARRT